MSPPAASRRDAGLRLISQLNRWTIAGALALAGVVSVVAEKSFHGHTATAASSQSASSSSGSSGSSDSSGGLQQPAQTPSAAPVPVAPLPAPVVSGGS